MTVHADCPYGPDDCPKIEDLEVRVRKMEANMNKILYIMYFIAGITSVELGIVII
jgi:hypothetical protein